MHIIQTPLFDFEAFIAKNISSRYSHRSIPLLSTHSIKTISLSIFKLTHYLRVQLLDSRLGDCDIMRQYFPTNFGEGR